MKVRTHLAWLSASVSIFLGLAACSSSDAADCSTTGCPAGQTCSAGVCVGQAAAGASAGGSSGLPTAGSATSGGGTSPSAGAPGASGGNVSMTAGSGNGSGGSSGSSTSAGSSPGGTSPTAGAPGNGGSGGTTSGGSGSGGAGGSGGSAEMMCNPMTVGQCKDDYLSGPQNGSATRYDFIQGTQLPACAYVITHKGAGRDGDWDTVEGISTGDGGYFGAMNTQDYNAGAACGSCVEASYNGKKVLLTIVDECPKGSNPKCSDGSHHIDMSRKAIRQLEPNGSQEDLHGVSWHYVKCPATGNAQVRLHPNQTADWQPVVIENGLYPMKSVKLNGVQATRTGNNTGGNAWSASGKKPPYTVEATDVNGNGLCFKFDGGNQLKDVGSQFKCQ